MNCSFTVKVLRNGRLVAKYKLLKTFENFDVGRTIARYPFETIVGFVTGFASAACMALMWAVPFLKPVAAVVTAIGLTWSTANAFSTYIQTGDVIEALTVSPLGIVVAPFRAFTDPTMDDSVRATVIGAMVGVPVGAFVVKK